MFLSNWLIGLFVIFVIGNLTTWIFIKSLRWYTGTDKRIDQKKNREKKRIESIQENYEGNIKTHEEYGKTYSRVPAWIIGTIEQLFFSVAIAFDISGIVIGMIGWITIKMASHWNLDKEKFHATDSFTALMGNMVSMSFALIAGIIFSYEKDLFVAFLSLVQ